MIILWLDKRMSLFLKDFLWIIYEGLLIFETDIQMTQKNIIYVSNAFVL